jgi:mRNA interferase RelE/StbE
VSGSEWRLELAPSAQRDLKRLDRQIMRRVLDAVDRVVADPDHATGVRKLAGRPELRLRVGDWRVLFIQDDQAREIRVLRVLPRGRAYDR